MEKYGNFDKNKKDILLEQMCIAEGFISKLDREFSSFWRNELDFYRNMFKDLRKIEISKPINEQDIIKNLNDLLENFNKQFQKWANRTKKNLKEVKSHIFPNEISLLRVDEIRDKYIGKVTVVGEDSKECNKSEVDFDNDFNLEFKSAYDLEKSYSSQKPTNKKN